MKVICISGHARAGKDTFASYLKRLLSSVYNENENSVLITHYGDLVKYICTTFFGWDGKKDEAGRSMLQHIGTDVVRAQDEGFWVRFISDMLTFFPDKWNYVIIPDCRFPNEIELLRDAGYDVTHVEIVRDDFDNELTEEQKHHPSETSLDEMIADFIVVNDGDLMDLFLSAKTFLGGMCDEDYQR